MTSFIEDVLLDLKLDSVALSDKTIIVPSKRAAVFIKYHLAKILKQTSFVPRIISIEDFVEELSELRLISANEQLFRFYTTYLTLTPEESSESFESFSKWATILLQDFNEIDRYLVNENSIFDYISAIQETNHWSLNTEKSELITNYLKFWNNLKFYYQSFTNDLMASNLGYQGLVYRQAVENLESYIEVNKKNKHVFLGFNALNKAESYIIQTMLQNDLASIYWDIDKVFLDDELHDAGLFLRHHKSQWAYFKSNTFNWITNNYSQKKSIKIFGVPKLVGQAKLIGELLESLDSDHLDLKKTAIVLGDELLLEPLLNSIPKNIDAVNITMGFPLSSVPLSSLFEKLFYIHIKSGSSFYYKDVLSILSNREVQRLITKNGKNLANEITEDINTKNILFLTLNELKAAAKDSEEVIELLFGKWSNSHTAISTCKHLIMAIKTQLNKSENTLLFEHLYRFNKLFNELDRLNETYGYFDSISSLHSVYKDLLNSETMDFKGEPLEGLQIMGMLESRVLDFETVIIASVNEGILPAGKSNNSFIPYDVKLENKLPTYKEKDAVYTYHFYRLLQRAKNVYIIYNTELGALNGGEKSRFITQLELEGIHNIEHKIAAPLVPRINNALKQISKTPEIYKLIKDIAIKGFSPSSLTNYIRNPIDFYYQKVLGISEFDTVEETVASNTLGSVIHNTLEDFYKPFEGNFLNEELLNQLIPNIDKTVSGHFQKLYKQGDLSKGKNLIILEIAKRYIYNFIQSEIKSLKNGHSIQIISVEKDINVTLEISELEFPVRLKGKIDRIDLFDGETRVIDYKTGFVGLNKVEIINWEDLTTDYDKYSKAFQILCYSYALHLSGDLSLPITAGVISFKNLQKGLLPFSKKDRAGRGAQKDSLITSETLLNFRTQLKELIMEICDANIPFIEKEIDNAYSN